MKMHVVVNSRNEVIATAAVTPITVTPITAGRSGTFVGIDPLPDQTVYELEIPDVDVPKDPLELHKKCDRVIKSGAAQRLEQLFQ